MSDAPIKSQLSVSVFHHFDYFRGPDRVVVGEGDLKELADTVLDMAGQIRAVGVVDSSGGSPAKLVTVQRLVADAEKASKRILTSKPVFAHVISPCMMPGEPPTGPALRILGVAEQATDRLEVVLRYLSSALSNLLQSDCVLIDHDPEELNLSLRVQWILQPGEPLTPAPVTEQLEYTATELKNLLADLDSRGAAADGGGVRVLPTTTSDSTPDAARVTAHTTSKEPSQEAIAVYRYWLVTGRKQTELADDPALMKILGHKISQGTISRMVKRVRIWLETGNVLPPLPKSSKTEPIPMDPERIDLGPNREHRTEGQKNRRSADAN